MRQGMCQALVAAGMEVAPGGGRPPGPQTPRPHRRGLVACGWFQRSNKLLHHPTLGILRLDHATSQAVRSATLPPAAMRAVRGNRIAMISPEPMTSLNPVFSVRHQVTEAMRIHDRGAQGAPELLIADEPPTAPDVTVQAQILDLLRDLPAQGGMAIILITHDLGVVAGWRTRWRSCTPAAWWSAPPATAIFDDPQHPCTPGLLGSMPRVEDEREHLPAVEGMAPPPFALPLGLPPRRGAAAAAGAGQGTGHRARRRRRGGWRSTRNDGQGRRMHRDGSGKPRVTR